MRIIIVFYSGYFFDILEEAIIMAGGIGTKRIFISPTDSKMKLSAYYAKLRWSEGSFSDPIALLNIYKAWKKEFPVECFQEGRRSNKIREENWARENYVELKALKVI